MALFNYAAKEITLKIVYYGPGLCGKTTNLQHLHATMSPEKRSKLLSLSTESDRTLFFDFMPVALGKIKDFDIKFQLYTVPGQVRYNATRKLVLKGADAIVFVADSQKAMKEANVESLQNMKENLQANNIDPDNIPVVLQYNKRDLENILSVDELNGDINPNGDRIIEAAAINGTGVDETFKLVTQRLLKHISKKHNVHIEMPAVEEAPPSDASFILERPGSKDTVVNISVKDKSSEALHAGQFASESEIEDDILKTSFPEMDTDAEEAIDMDETAATAEPVELEDVLEREAPFGAERPAGRRAERSNTDGVPELLRLILEELKESRKQQASLLISIEKLTRAIQKIK